MDDYNFRERRYISVRSWKSGGSRVVTNSRTAKYDEVINRLTDTFYPNGRYPLGKISKFGHKLWDSNLTNITSHNFDVMTRTDVGDARKARLYLLSKENVIKISIFIIQICSYPGQAKNLRQVQIWARFDHHFRVTGPQSLKIQSYNGGNVV